MPLDGHLIPYRGTLPVKDFSLIEANSAKSRSMVLLVSAEGEIVGKLAQMKICVSRYVLPAESSVKSDLVSGLTGSHD